jgi:flagellar basal-body rod protein FlgG
MVTEMVRQDQIANDLANASTPGYKSDRATQREFGALLLTNSATGADVGPLGVGVAVDRITTDLSAKPLRETGQALDFAVQGDGWLVVRTAQGERYTRNGRFMADAQRRLVTPTGALVLGRNGGPVTVGADGRVDPALLRVVTVNGAVKAGDNLFTGRPGGAATGTVRSSALEAAGTEPAKAMVDMIASMRAFEAGQKVISTIDDSLAKSASQVGALNG